jgi:prepilin-type N-terminal cleavage/methylation domain-containing protein
MNKHRSIRRAARGFSLLETVITVAILGVLCSIAVPNLLPEVQKARLDATTEASAAFFARARAEAMTARRCVRVIIANPQKLEAYRLNTFDCDVSPSAGPFIDATNTEWILIDSLVVDSKRVTLTWDPAPAETGPSGAAGGELRFRPSGRLWSDATTPANSVVGNIAALDNDDGVLAITHLDLWSFGNRNRKKVLVQNQGFICVLARGQEPNGSGNNLGCP